MPNTMENMAAKGAGKAGAVAAKLKGLDGVFVKLVEEHKEAATLLKRALSTEDTAKRADIWNKLRAELLSHERAELKEVYPSLDGADAHISGEHSRDAKVLETLIAEVDAQSYDSASWKESLERLQEVVEAHVDLEENQFFPQMQEALGKANAKEIEERYIRAKEAAMGRIGS